MPADQPLSFIRELDRRAIDGVDVRVLWNEYDGRVVVAVRALEVFDNPFAYAAERGSRRATSSWSSCWMPHSRDESLAQRPRV
jgi:hypothetical protein